MYRMITGKVPTESVERALEDDLQEPSKLGIAMHPSMENALMNALNVYQKDRTPSAEAFYRELTSKNTQRVKVKQRKRETGKLPVWAKGLVAVAVCGLIAGGAVLVRQGMENQEKRVASQKEEKFFQNINKPYGKFKKQWEEKYHYDINDVEKVYCYDSTVGNEEMVMEFEDLTKDKLLTEGASLQKKKDLKPKKGEDKIARIVIASQQKVTFQDKWLKNCFPIPKGKVQTYESRYYPQNAGYEKGSSSKPFGTIQEIKYDDITYSAEDMQKKKPLNQKPLDISKLQVKVYNGAYYSWPKDSNRKEDYYIGKLVRNVLFNYKKGDGKGEKDKNKAALRANQDYYEEKYLSFQDEEGTIKKVLLDCLKKGEKYSQKDGEGALFYVVGKKLTLGKVKVSEVEEECEKHGIILKTNGKADNAIVTKVDANLCEYGKRKTLRILEAISPATPTPRITPAPTNNSSATQPPAPRVQPKKPQKKPKNDHNTSNDM